MQGVDLAVVKDIPGYQIIMKAVLKHQIQQLVEQLSETTGEESILLTASVSDGSLSHLGSESGKSFLEGHEEIKSQFLGFVLKRHHNKKSEKQFAEGPGRKSASQQLFPHLYDADADSDTSYHFDPQPEIPAPVPAETPSMSGGKRKKKTVKTVPVTSDLKNRPKRSAAAMRSPLKSDIYVSESEDVDSISDSEIEGAESAAGMEVNNETTPVKYTEMVPVSDPIPVVPKFDTADPFQAQFRQGSVKFSGEMEEFGTDNVIVKSEAGLDIESVTMEDEEDPDWEPGTKKRRKSSSSRSVTSPVNVAGDQGQRTLQHQETDRVSVQHQATSRVSVQHQKDRRKKKSCKFCEKVFTKTSDVKRHERIHTGERPYSCEICGKSFKQSGQLYAHQKRHSTVMDPGDKPYCCETCGKSFRLKDYLIRHKKVHSGEKPYMCEICGRSFAFKQILSTHILTHTGERPYSCETCGKTFARNFSLNKHLRWEKRKSLKAENEPRSEKTNVLVLDLVPHKPDCTDTEDG